MVKKFIGSVIRIPWISIFKMLLYIWWIYNNLLFVKMIDRKKVRICQRRAWVSVWIVRLRSRPNWCSNHLGMDMTTTINIFLRQAIQYQGLPFDVRLDDHGKLLQVVTDVEQNRNMSQPSESGLRLDGGVLLCALRFVYQKQFKRF